jgi:uncharacterized protein YggE
MHMKRWLIAGMLLLVPAVLMAQQAQEQPRTITVNATAVVDREPDRAQLTLAVESQAATAREASQANASNMDRVIAALRAAGIPAARIRTTSYQLNPVYARPAPGGEARVSGYRAVNMVQVTIDSIARIGSIIDSTVGVGANRVAGLDFQIRDEESARLEALERAIAMARREAEVIARAAGQRLGPPLNIQTSYAFPMPRSGVAFEAMARDVAQVPTPVEAGTLQVTANVTMVFRIDSL